MSASKPRHILDLSVEEKKKFLDSFDSIFSDIDGVTWIMDHLIEGAGQGFQVMEKLGKKLRFITNNSVRPIEDCKNRFETIGLNIQKDDIWHPAKSTVEYLKSINFEGLIYVLGSSEFSKHISEAGFKYIDGPNEIFKEDFSAFYQAIYDHQPVRAVVVDVDFNLSVAKLIRAQLYLKNPDCILIAGATDRQLPISKSLSVIGPGYFQDILKASTKKEIIEVGKPGKELAHMLLQKDHITDSRRVLMIGDLLEQDIAFANRCGLQSLFVLSGAGKLEELKDQQNPDLIPDYYADSVADFVKLVEDVKE